MVVIWALAGCTSVGDRHIPETSQMDFGLTYPSHLDSVHIGKTTKDEVKKMFGNPRDLQVASDSQGARESWAYAKADPPLHPLQYVPIFGVLALPPDQFGHSFSMSFSAEGLVDSVGIQEFQPYEDGGAPGQTIAGASPVHPYGSHNPLTHHWHQDTLR
ncbi:hypothetical protein [Candidatus Nitronereus thalassa]|uniref:Lipoprotein n=1 Tax=Candidatus Nitronereus thalassa TaxID=3020898 RepID=A0ABU3K9N5_9BACT|nr:hypothetical protein [Candidatus Nitronereus thalassa]MDT7043122.1 hypothetical protein [Candidatus Nitronereus thalassa]